MRVLAQFIRAETHPLTRSTLSGKRKGRGKGRKGWNARDIRNEAERHPEAIPHIDRPEPPVILYGVTPTKVIERITVEVAKRKDLLRKAAAEGGKVRRIRKDQHTMIAGVVSYPVDWETIRKQPKEAAILAAWNKDVVEFLVEHHAKAGGELVSVIEHVDEPYPHLHFYALPVSSPTFAAREVHDGGRLKLEARAAGLSKPEEDAAYIRGTQILQDAFYFAVSQKYGHARHKGKRPRVARNIYVAEKKQIDRGNELLAKSRQIDDKKREQLAQKAADLEAQQLALDEAKNKLAAQAMVSAQREIGLDKREAGLRQQESDLAKAQTQLSIQKRNVAAAQGKAIAAEVSFREVTKDILPHVEKTLSSIKMSISKTAKIRDQYRHPRNPAEAQSFHVARSTVETLEQAAFALDTFLCVKSPPTEAGFDDADLEGESRPDAPRPGWERS